MKTNNTGSPKPYHVDTVTGIFIDRAVKISRLLHLHNEEWPDYPALPLRPVALVESKFSHFDPEALCAFFDIAPRYDFLAGDFAKGEMEEGRLKFETVQLVECCMEAWGLISMSDIWPLAEEVIKLSPEGLLDQTA